MMLSRGNDFRWLRDAKLPDTTTHLSKAYVAAGATYLKNETFIGPGSWQSLEISSSKTARAEGAAILRRLTDCEAAIRRSRHIGYAREAQPLLLVMTYCQRIGDFFVGRAGKGSRKACSCHVEEGTADVPKLALAA
jgi:hypothetical protein